MTGAEILARALTDLLDPAGITVQADEGTLGEIDPETVAAGQLVTVSAEPTTMQGQWLMRWELWVCTPATEAAEIRQQLNWMLPTVVELLERVDWLTIERATRETHPDNFAAWRFTIVTLTPLP